MPMTAAPETTRIGDLDDPPPVALCRLPVTLLQRKGNAAAVQAIMDAARRSASQKSWVDVERL
jgi:hypothetical protein